MTDHELEELHLRLAKAEWSQRRWRRLAIVSTSLLALLLVAGAFIGLVTSVALQRQRQQTLAEMARAEAEIAISRASVLEQQEAALQETRELLNQSRRAFEAAQKPAEEREP
jgi:hypothetical protein